MYFYKVWAWDFIKHVWIPHSISTLQSARTGPTAQIHYRQDCIQKSEENVL